jgi:hypothetical protein
VGGDEGEGDKELAGISRIYTLTPTLSLKGEGVSLTFYDFVKN